MSWCVRRCGIRCDAGHPARARMSGTTPKGIRDERQAAAWVREMFGQVAPRYDLLNQLLSFNIDQWWRARTVRRLRPILDRPGAVVLDLCCGTGDLAIALSRNARARVLGERLLSSDADRGAAQDDSAVLRGRRAAIFRSPMRVSTSSQSRSASATSRITRTACWNSGAC